MNHIVKELFNSLYSHEEKALKTNPKSRIKPKMINGYKYPSGARIHFDFDNVIKFSDETDFIIFKNDDIFYPITWDNLTIDYISKDIRHCEECDKTVYKVSNKYIYDKCTQENLCMAISNDTLERIKVSLDNSEYEKISNTILISKLFLQYENTYVKNHNSFEDFKKDNCTRELAFKSIILDILDSNNIQETIEDYNEHGVNLEIILIKIVPTINDDIFKAEVEEKIVKLTSQDN